MNICLQPPRWVGDWPAVLLSQVPCAMAGSQVCCCQRAGCAGAGLGDCRGY